MRKLIVLVGVSLASGLFASDSKSLIDAVAADDLQQVKFLLAAGVDVNAKHDGVAPIHVAGSVAIATLLIEAGAEVNALIEDDTERTALHIAPRRGGEGYQFAPGDSAVAMVLIAAGADVNAVAKDQSTPLHYAAIFCNAEVAEALIRAGAEVNSNADGMTPLDASAICKYFYGKVRITEVLLANGAEGELYRKLEEDSQKREEERKKRGSGSD